MELKMQMPLTESLRQMLADSLMRLAARRRARRHALQLAAMSEQELLDLGIGRSEVPALLRGAPRARTDRSTRGQGRECRRVDAL